MKPNPLIPQLVALLGGPSLFPHLNKGQIEELLEEQLADMLAQLHAERRAHALRDFMEVDTEARRAAAGEICTKLAADTTRLTMTVDAASVAAFPVADMSLSPRVEDLCRKAKELWHLVPPPRGPLDFLVMLRSKGTSKRKARRG
jgi:hypothetical protein